MMQLFPADATSYALQPYSQLLANRTDREVLASGVAGAPFDTDVLDMRAGLFDLSESSESPAAKMPRSPCDADAASALLDSEARSTIVTTC